jgi:hypothetical protein
MPSKKSKSLKSKKLIRKNKKTIRKSIKKIRKNMKGGAMITVRVDINRRLTDPVMLEIDDAMTVSQLIGTVIEVVANKSRQNEPGFLRRFPFIDAILAFGGDPGDYPQYYRLSNGRTGSRIDNYDLSLEAAGIQNNTPLMLSVEDRGETPSSGNTTNTY